MSKKFEYWYAPSKLIRFADLPGYDWKYMEAPRSLAPNMGGLPISDSEFGVIATDRMVLESHREKAGLQPVKRIGR